MNTWRGQTDIGALKIHDDPPGNMTFYFIFLNLRANKPSVVYWLILKKVKAALLLYRKGEKVRLHLSVCVRRRPSIPVTCYPSAQFIHSTARSDLAVLGVSLLVRAAVELQAAFVLPFVHATGEWSFK